MSRLIVRICHYGLLIGYILNGVAGYQFDTDNVILYEDASGPDSRSYFGYSVDLWNYPGSSSVKPSIVVGAPRGNSSFEKTVFQPGTVFSCEIGKKCEEWNLPTGHDGSWLGGALAVKNSTDFETVVCAPRWTGGKHHDAIPPMRGMCFRVITDNVSHTNPEPFYPLGGEETFVKVERNAYFLAHLGESGFSIHLTPDCVEDVRYVIGSPGFYLDSGNLIIRKNDNELFVPSTVTNVYYFPGFHSYYGYAVTSGKYRKGSHTYVIGSPRSGELHGAVVGAILITDAHDGASKLSKKFTAEKGEQFGEYFGATLASCDINKDGWDELLVGAPHWSKSDSHDEGRIYIFTGHRINGKFQILQRIDGKNPGARYGSAIACLGDIDYDGFGDVAVGAPYDGNGAVHIYHGSEAGLKPTQTILAPSGTNGFGFSISKAIDIDNNGYSDIAVGAYLSGHVTLLRSKRVVSTKVELKTNLTGEPITIGKHDTSFEITACSSFNGKYPPGKLRVIRRFEIDGKYQRAYVNDVTKYEFNDQVIIFNRSAECRTYIVLMKDDVEEFLEPLKVSVTQRLKTSNEKGTLIIGKNGERSGEDHYDKSSAVAILTRQEEQQELEIFFALECGTGAKCTSNLSIHVDAIKLKNISHYLIGSSPVIELDITVSNTADAAYYTQSFLYMPNFIKLGDGPPECRSYESGNQTAIVCLIANPLDKNMTKNLTLYLDMLSVPSNTSMISFGAKVTTRSNNTVGRDETVLEINCMAETDLGIAGETDLDLHRYELPREEEKESSSVRVQHTYEIENYHVTPIFEAELSVSIPTHWIHRGDEIEVVSVNDTITKLNGEEFDCMYREENDDVVTPNTCDAYTSTKWLTGNMSKFHVIDDEVFGASPDNITLFVNCTSPMFKCKTLDCRLGPLNSTQPMASLVLIFDVLLHSFTPERMKARNIVFIVTNGSTRITEASGITQTIDNEPDAILIGTRFIGEPSKYQKPPPIWMLVLAVSVGLLLLMIIILGLWKFGFFRRNSVKVRISNREKRISKISIITTSKEKKKEEEEEREVVAD